MSVEISAAMHGRIDIKCSLQYLIDKIPYIAEDACIDKHGVLDMNMNVDAVSLYTGEDDLPRTGSVYLCCPEHLSRHERIDVSYPQDNIEIYFYIMLFNGTISDESEMRSYSA